MYSHLVHSRRVHILGHNTECNVALDQCSCSKTSGMVFCVSKGHKPLGGSLTYQVLNMNTVHPQARLEFQLSEGRIHLADLISMSGEFFWTANHKFAGKDFAENVVFHCAFYPIHWPFPMMGFVVVPSQAYLGVNQSEHFKREFGPKLWGATNEFWYSSACSCSGMSSSHFFDYQSSIKNLRGRSLGQHKYD